MGENSCKHKTYKDFSFYLVFFFVKSIYDRLGINLLDGQFML